MIRLAATPAGLSIVQNTHTGIKETSNAGLISIVGSCICDFDPGPSLNLLGTEDPELNANDRLNI